jgi:hypothetical protein
MGRPTKGDPSTTFVACVPTNGGSKERPGEGLLDEILGTVGNQRCQKEGRAALNRSQAGPWWASDSSAAGVVITHGATDEAPQDV